MPPVDLAEFPDRYVLSMELAGLRRQDVTIEVVGSALRIHGQRPGPRCCPERYLQLERGQGAFARTFQFAHSLDGGGVTADLVDGVLSVVIPKTERVKREVDIA
jgi:HSP20 family protein